MRFRFLVVSSLLALALTAGAGCTLVSPTDPFDDDARFCVTQNQGESLLCCPSPGLGCQAVEAANES